MKILYVEDDPTKVKQVLKFLKENVPGCNLTIRNSYTSGVLEIRSNKFDLILLDMSLPLYDILDCDPDESNDFETFAGIDILEEMKRIRNSTNVIIITAFDVLGDNENRVNLKQLDDRMSKEYTPFYKGIIHYNTFSLEWSNMLKIFINDNYNM
jgi:CheY-like chemotaxis protein